MPYIRVRFALLNLKVVFQSKYNRVDTEEEYLQQFYCDEIICKCPKCLDISESARAACSTAQQQAGSSTAVGGEIHGLLDHDNESNTAIEVSNHMDGCQCAERKTVIEPHNTDNGSRKRRGADDVADEREDSGNRKKNRRTLSLLDDDSEGNKLSSEVNNALHRNLIIIPHRIKTCPIQYSGEMIFMG